jgi:hypothetical protein
MSHWNYRVVHQVFIHENGEKEDSYGIHECYYDDDGNPRAISTLPDQPVAETVEGLQDVLSHMEQALSKPVLEYNDF